jgi:aminomethyltransferase
MKYVALNDLHVSLGAKMIEFAGYNMPVLYTNLIQEHNAVRNSVGVFDVSHMGEFMLKGEKALDLIQLVTSKRCLANLPMEKCSIAAMPNDQGGIVDDLLVYRWSQDEYYLVVNASNIEKDWNWIRPTQHIWC